MPRPFLTVVDDYTGKFYEHRREWIETQILNLADIFAIDVAAYAVINSNEDSTFNNQIQHQIKPKAK